MFMKSFVLAALDRKSRMTRKHVGTLRGLFEKVRNRIDIGVWESWHLLYTFIGDPSSRPPPINNGWLIA